MSSVVDKLTSIFQSITSLGSIILDGIGGFFETLFNYFTELLSYLNPFNDNFILKIFFDWLKDLIYEVFVPDTELINQQFNNTISNLQGRLGITMYNLDNLFDTSAKPTNVSSDYNIAGVGTLNLQFVNYDYLAQGVNFFRPFIRGLLVLLLFIFNVRQLMSLFGLSTGEIIGYSASKGGEDK